MGIKKDELVARLAKVRTVKDYQSIPEELFRAAQTEEQQEREAAEDAYWKKFDEIINEHPIGHPRRCGLGGCVVGFEDDPE